MAMTVAAKTSPARLVAALTASGWFEEGRGRGHVRLRWGSNPDSLVVPTDTTAPEYEAMMTAALATLERAADYGAAAERAHELATCSCGGRRWTEDENWQPEPWAMGTKPRRRPGEGLIPCGGCNFGGWNVDPVDVGGTVRPIGEDVIVADERVAVWMDHYHSPHVEVCDSEQKAANFAAGVEEHGELTVVGAQFADGRTVPVEQWAAFREAQEQRRAAWKARAEEAAANPPPVREIVAPFGLGTVEVDLDEPDWLGVR